MNEKSAQPNASAACPWCSSTDNPPEAAYCAVCAGPLGAQAGNPIHLPPGTQLKGGEYEILDTLGQGGFAITYRAHSRTWEADVALKELFLSEGQICSRLPGGTQVVTNGTGSGDFAQYRRRFRDEAAHLFRISHTNAVKVFDRFDANNTTYLVMEMVPGRTLEAVAGDGAPLAEAEALAIVTPLAHCLERVHAHGIVHRDVAPRNVVLRENGEPVLIDFGLARDFVVEKTRSAAAFTDGYSPPEQYSSDMERGPYSDVYSLAAVLAFLLSGKTPPSSLDRLNGRPLELPGKLSDRTHQAIEAALAMKIAHRTPTMAAFLAGIDSRAGNGESEKELQSVEKERDRLAAKLKEMERNHEEQVTSMRSEIVALKRKESGLLEQVNTLERGTNIQLSPDEKTMLSYIAVYPGCEDDYYELCGSKALYTHMDWDFARAFGEMGLFSSKEEECQRRATVIVGTLRAKGCIDEKDGKGVVITQTGMKALARN